jgi:UDP-GlcNAc:undecaprenyl-phosphate/decaprenyl-phosphate GlcNAc-1-phosphate transferase
MKPEMLIGMALAFGVSLILTPILAGLARKNGLVDNPAGDSLKIHRKPIPYLGGGAVLLGMLAGFPLSLPGGLPYAASAGILLIFGVGLVDDARQIKPGLRFLFQLLAGALVLAAGFSVNVIPFLWAVVPLTLFYIAGAINAVNVIDGMDGLAAGTGIVSCLGFMAAGIIIGDGWLTSLAGILLAALLGFLPYNFNPAKVFLGDAGSGFIGMVLGLMAVRLSSQAYAWHRFGAAILIIGIPVFDLAFAITRRKLSGKPVFAGDRSHIYDVLERKGLSQKMVWSIMMSAAAVLAGIGCAVVR